jgi:hypothetical protein
MSAEIVYNNTAEAQDELLIRVPLQVAGLSTIYSIILGQLERRYPIKPDHTWAEVAGGVLISLVPVALAARRRPGLSWQTYENAVWRSFFASGTPIILWQLAEAVVRHVELLRYTAERDGRSVSANADSTTPLADRSGNGAGRGSSSGERGDIAATEGSGDD